ncbi:hypothetical protein KCU89_g5307, partial [Aureobasidium melanogenum]
MTRPKYTSVSIFARRKRQESIARRRRHQARLRMLAVAPKVFSSPALVGLILSHIADKSALARFSLVCKLWSHEAARHLWNTCTQLLNLEHEIRPVRHGRVASLIHHLHLEPVIQLWSGTSPEMPKLTNLRTLKMHDLLFMDPFESPYMSRLLSGSLQELRLTDHASSPMSHSLTVKDSSPRPASWLRSLDQACPSLQALLLNIRLTPETSTELELFLLCSSLQDLKLGPLLLENFDDWTIAIILAQRDLRVLEFRLPITTESLAIYRKQCNALPTLDKLQQLFITFNVSAEKVMAALFSCTPNLTYLDVTIEHTPDGTSWSPDDTAFLAIGQLKHLRTLTICIGTSSTCDTGITCSNLLDISDLPLTSLIIQPCQADTYYPLFLREVTCLDFLHVLRRWQSPEFLHLLMICEEVVGAAKQKRELRRLLNRINISHLHNISSLCIKTYVIDDAATVDPEIWLGSNSNFRPDPREWVPRRLYEPGALSDRVANDQQDSEDDLMVMGNAVEQEDGPNSEGSVVANANEN